MRAQRDDLTGRPRGQRRARALLWLGTVVSVLVAAVVVLRGRRPALPAFVAQRRPATAPTAPAQGPTSQAGARPSPRHRAAEPVAEPVADADVDGVAGPPSQSDAEPVAEPVAEPIAEPVAEPSPEPVAEPLPEPIAEPVAEPVAGSPPVAAVARSRSSTRASGAPAGAGLAQLVRVSGLGRRSAEALVVAGIASLEDLAASDPAALGAALDAAGVKRAATVTSWPQQAAKLLAP